MIDIANILRLAGDGYGLQDIRKFTRVHPGVIKKVCQEAGVTLQDATSKRPVVLVKNSLPEPKKRQVWEEQAIIPKGKQSPLQFAFAWLAGRLVEKPGRGYYLDNVPANLEYIMKAANRAAEAKGAEMLLYSERWKP